MQAKRDEAKARLWAERIAAFERSGLGRRANGGNRPASPPCPDRLS